MKYTKAGTGFTLIELLLVIVIIGILIGLLGTIFQTARTRSRRIKCSTETRELAKAWQAYYGAYDVLPAGGVMDAGKVSVLQGNNTLKIKFMDFSTDAAANGFRDPWGNLYRVTLSTPGLMTNWQYKTRVYLINKKAYPYE